MENKNLDLQKSLEFIGFSEKEVVVYLALLELGKGTVTQISRKAGINRPTGYHVLASLEVKELVKASGKEPKQEYVAESPDQIEKILQEKIKNDEIFIKEARKIIPELKSIHNVTDRPKVFFYEGREGMEKVYEDTLTSHEPIRAYATADDMHAGLPGIYDAAEYRWRRASADQGDGGWLELRSAITADSFGRREGLCHLRTVNHDSGRSQGPSGEDPFRWLQLRGGSVPR